MPLHSTAANRECSSPSCWPLEDPGVTQLTPLADVDIGNGADEEADAGAWRYNEIIQRHMQGETTPACWLSWFFK